MDAGGTMVGMKNCKTCQAEIPANAPKCKYCGSSQRAGFLGISVVIICALLVIAWIVIHKASAKPGLQSAAAHSVSMCEQAVRRAASHPASIDFSAFGSQPPTEMAGGGYQVRLAFAEKDASGDSIAKVAICTVTDGKLQSFKEPKP
jgi:RNA polymerase subunit RPABC4/transcription elongation factor Spt4